MKLLTAKQRTITRDLSGKEDHIRLEKRSACCTKVKKTYERFCGVRFLALMGRRYI